MTEPKKNDAPSAEAQKCVQHIQCGAEEFWHAAENIDALLSRVRREARAEAFEHIGAALRSYGELEFAEHAEALAEKERAK